MKKLRATDREQISEISGNIWEEIEKIQMPGDIEAAIADELSHYDERAAFAVRSSATAEDLPNASFAGQQDTYLNIKDSRASSGRKTRRS